jgi:MazG family protein
VSAFDDLIAIVARLREEGGCPWDRAQTLESMRPYLLEEVYEVLHAIDHGDDVELKKELGDLLFQGVMLSRMAEERGAFDIGEVLHGIVEKMVQRHPHVFDDGYAIRGDEGDVLSWEARKAARRPGDHSALDGVPRALPALLRAHRISEKASSVGFDWKDLAGIRAKVDEELGELDQAIATRDDQRVGEEFGDLLFTLVNLGRFLPMGAEEALRTATVKFENRFRALERALAADGRSVYHTDAETLESYWAAVKEDACS